MTDMPNEDFVSVQHDIEHLKREVDKISTRLDSFQTKDAMNAVITTYERRIADLEQEVKRGQQWANDQHQQIMKSLNDELKLIRKELNDAQDKGYEKLEQKIEELKANKVESMVWANRLVWGLIASGALSIALYWIEKLVFH